MKPWGKIFKRKHISSETSRQDTYRLVAIVNTDIDDIPKLVLEIEDTGIARRKLVSSQGEDGSPKELEEISKEDETDEISLHQRIIVGFFFLTTFYILAVVKLSIDIPRKFKSFEDIKDVTLTDKINIIASSEGLWTLNLVPIIAFLSLGLLLHSLEDAKNAEYLRGLWHKTVAGSVTVLAVLVTIFSVWS